MPHSSRPIFHLNLTNGTTKRTPLLQQGQTLADINPGLYPVTGGGVRIGTNTISPHTNTIISILVNDAPLDLIIDGPLNKKFNENFASVLFEMNKAGIQSAGFYNMDSYDPPAGLLPENGPFTRYILECAHSFGLAQIEDAHNNAVAGIPITSQLINAVAIAQ